MTPEEKQRILSMMPSNDKMAGSVWAIHVHRDQISASAKHVNGVVVLSLMVAIGRDNKRHSRAKKMAEKCARNFFKWPKFVRKGIVRWDGNYPVLYYRERGLL